MRGPDVPSYGELWSRTDAPAGSAWGLFGAGDELGAVNLLTHERVLAGIRSVTRGDVFTLDYPLDRFAGAPLRPPPTQSIVGIGRRDDGTVGEVDRPAAILDDYLDGFWLQTSSHIDGLRHVAHHEHGFYGGATRAELAADTPRLGVNRWAERGIVGRGVLVDVARQRESQSRPLDHAAGEAFGPELLEETLAGQRTVLEPGDMLLVRTGYPAHWAAHTGERRALLASAGLERTHRMAQWLWDRQIPLVAADNTTVEATLGADRSDFGPDPLSGMLHTQLIPLLGMVIGELWRLDELAADCAGDGVYAFLLVVKPLNVVGAVGSPANATAVK
jgi:kynurenine formamidase